MIRLLIWSALASAAVTGAAKAQPAPDNRGFELCNRTQLTVVFAKAVNTATDNRSDDITADGWYTLEPGKCRILWPGTLIFQYYMIYAEAKNSNRKWTGNQPLCVDTRDFSLSGQSKACPLDRPRRPFLQIDTGEALSYTYYLE